MQMHPAKQIQNNQHDAIPPHVKRRINTPKATRPSCEQSSDDRCERQASNAVHRAGTAAAANPPCKPTAEADITTGPR